MSKLAMTEPASSTVAGLMLYKIGAWGLGAGLAAIVVMSMTPPKDAKEMFVCLVSTVIGSISVGSAVILYFNLQPLTESLLGLMSLLGLVFACGLPAWFLVRAWFVFTVNNSDKDIKQIIEGLLSHARK